MSKTPESSIGQSSSARTKRSPQSSDAGTSSPVTAKGTPAYQTTSNQPGASSSSSGVVDQAKQTLSNVASQAGDKVSSTLESQKDRAADSLSGIVQALRQTGDKLRDQGQQAAVPQYLSSAADQVDRLGHYLRSTDLRQMAEGVERFARRQPAIFIGGAFALGLLGARFLKSSRPQSSDRRYSSTRELTSDVSSRTVYPDSMSPAISRTTEVGGTTGARDITGAGGVAPSGGPTTGSTGRAGTRATKPRED